MERTTGLGTSTRSMTWSLNPVAGRIPGQTFQTDHDGAIGGGDSPAQAALPKMGADCGAHHTHQQGVELVGRKVRRRHTASYTAWF